MEEDNGMPELEAIEIKAHVPALDFEVSKQFYQDIRFTKMHLLVKDVDAWWAQIQAKQISQKYAVKIGPPDDRDWKMRDFVLFDPSGVLWRVAQDID
jgi:uncharacterized glyoxalase superfamily protein PhnB